MTQGTTSGATIRPVILCVDDDTAVLRAVTRDLRSRYGKEYRILSAENGQSALEALRELKQRQDPVALIVSDHRMPQMDGVQLLSEVRELLPETKRVLLTAYADTEAAIRAINIARLDFYLLKPWDPPEENLYPVLNDVLDDWRGNYKPPFVGVRVLGSRWSPRSFEVREFLARNHVPYRFSSVEAIDAEVVTMRERLGTGHLPAVFLQDGTMLSDPSLTDIAEKVGLKTQAERDFYDLIVVGAGPAGLAAGVYGASEGLRTVLLEREAPGGQASLSSRIENYLGFPVGLSGADLTRRAVTQAQRFGVEILSPQEVVAVRSEAASHIVELSNGKEISGHVVLVATGVQWRKIDTPGFERLQGAGVYYGAGSTEALACKNETVYVIGGANSAGQAAMNFSKYASKVIMLVRGPSLAASMSQYLIDQIAETSNIEVWTHSQVMAALGEERLEAIQIFNSQSNTTQDVAASSLFIFIGAAPRTDWLPASVKRDKYGFIITGALVKGSGWSLEREPYLLETSQPGIFAAGDVRSGSVKRVASGVGEGSISVQFVHQYLANL
jgi:thioredoxin reductase (NADPH)